MSGDLQHVELLRPTLGQWIVGLYLIAQVRHGVRVARRRVLALSDRDRARRMAARRARRRVAGGISSPA